MNIALGLRLALIQVTKTPDASQKKPDEEQAHSKTVS